MRMTRQTIRLATLLVFLALVAYLVVHPNGLTTNQAVGEVEGEAVEVGRMAVRDKYAIIASLVLVALFGFVMWAAIRANKGEDEAKPPPGNETRSTRRP
jgi:hypothetical protein